MRIGYRPQFHRILMLRYVILPAAFTCGAVCNAIAVSIPPCTSPPFDGIAEVRSLSEPLALMLHEILLVNESLGGKVAYCLSDAHMSNGLNGLSFGPSQLDLHQNPVALETLNELIGMSVDDGQAVLSAAQISSIRKGALSQSAPLIRQSHDPALEDLMEKINVILRRDDARTKMNQLYAKSLARSVQQLNITLKGVDNSIGASDYLEQTPSAKLIILDYQNFFGNDIGMLKIYLSGKSVMLGQPARMVPTAKKPLSISDLMAFVLSTKQGSGLARDERMEVLRRLDTVFSVAEQNNVSPKLLSKDNDYFSGPLHRILLESTVAGSNAFRPDSIVLSHKMYPGLWRIIDAH